MASPSQAAGSSRAAPKFATMSPQEVAFLNAQQKKVTGYVADLKNAQNGALVAGAEANAARIAKEKSRIAKEQVQKEKEQAGATREIANTEAESARLRREKNEDLLVQKLGEKLKKTGSLPPNEMKVYQEYSAKIAARKK